MTSILKKKQKYLCGEAILNPEQNITPIYTYIYYIAWPTFTNARDIFGAEKYHENKTMEVHKCDETHKHLKLITLKLI